MPIIAGLGEVLWDILPDGRKLGGAPANFAFHVNNLGGEGIPVSRVGDDALGREAVDILRGNGLDVSCVAFDPAHPTGTVLAELDAEGKASYVFPPDVAWDFLECTGKWLDLAGRADAVCFGSLAQRSSISRRAIRCFVEATDHALVVCDVNLRQDFYSAGVLDASLAMADVCKLNDEELPVLAGLLGIEPERSAAGESDETLLLRGLRDKYGLRLAALTRGERGSLLLTGDTAHDHPGLAETRVADTIGAGDAFTAALTLGLLAGWSLERINERANRVAAAVCGQPGGMAQLPAALRIF